MQYLRSVSRNEGVPVPKLASPLIPVVTITDAASADGLASALVAGGIPVAEVTLRTPAGLAAIARMAQRGDIQVGAGTVVNAKQLEQAVAAGASFAVSPGASPEVLDRAASLGVWLIPGAATATEIMALRQRGIADIKLFPASIIGGPAAIKAYSQVFPDIRFMPTGGINQTNLAEYLTLAAVDHVGGSWMVPKDVIANGDFDHLTELVTQAAAQAARITAGEGR
jgi:2-dehydro-3-deoxyphosphogluconate aldolase/(4S)-4-hydroxy-2-oxoglutarate aldolase